MASGTQTADNEIFYLSEIFKELKSQNIKIWMNLSENRWWILNQVFFKTQDKETFRACY